MSLDKSNINVIVVEDDVTNGRLLNMMLSRNGYNTTICPNISATQEAASAETAVFIVDCKLGIESGLDLLRMIRAGELNCPPETCVIMASGTDIFENEAMELGAHAYMLKPYPLMDLMKQLDQLLPDFG